MDNLNYKIFGCYNLLNKLRFKDLRNNIGIFFGIGFILFNIICCFIFYFYYLPRIRIKIYKLVPNTRILLKRYYFLKKEKDKKEKKEKRKESKSKTNIVSSKIKTSLIDVLPRQNKKSKTKNRKTNFYKYKDKIRNQKESEYKIIKLKKETVNNFEKIGEKDYNCLPYSQALKSDNRNFFSIYISLIKMKIIIIAILFFSEEFNDKSSALSIYTLEIQFNFFLNTLLYTDDIVSQKYHNNGYLNLFTTVFLSLTSNIISSIIMYFIEKLVSYRKYLPKMVKELKEKYEYILTFKKLYLVLKIQIFFFFIISFILSLFFTLYVLIFCEIYKKSQISLLINYIIGIIESLAYSFGVSIIICILRYLGLKLKIIYLYRTSVYLDGIL